MGQYIINNYGDYSNTVINVSIRLFLHLNILKNKIIILKYYNAVSLGIEQHNDA